MLFPNDHARTLIEMLKGFGPEGSDLVRRWVVALLLVPEHERAGVVGAVEARITSAYSDAEVASASGGAGVAGVEPTVYVSSGEVQREGHTELIERAYVPASEVQAGSLAAAKGRGGRKSGGAPRGGAA